MSLVYAYKRASNQFQILFFFIFSWKLKIGFPVEHGQNIFGVVEGPNVLVVSTVHNRHGLGCHDCFIILVIFILLNWFMELH